jgi:hypothetical protein
MMNSAEATMIIVLEFRFAISLSVPVRFFRNRPWTGRGYDGTAKTPSQFTRGGAGAQWPY